MTTTPDPVAELSAQALVERLQLSKSYASELIRRVRTPSLELACRIEAEFGVPPKCWLRAA
ncbi:MAG: helix-turn-helix transcriptional regulator [Proteobacteria bacterium]|nr:helix-turn-helix transcriptional regulator [Pseudomonadota bacterium]